MRTWVPQRLATHSCHKQWNQDINLDQWLQSCPLFQTSSFLLPQRESLVFSHTHFFSALLQSGPRTHFYRSSSVRLQPFPKGDFSLLFPGWHVEVVRPFWGTAGYKNCHHVVLLSGSEVWTARLSSLGSQEWWFPTPVSHLNHQGRFEKYQCQVPTSRDTDLIGLGIEVRDKSSDICGVQSIFKSDVKDLGLYPENSVNSWGPKQGGDTKDFSSENLIWLQRRE